MIRLFSFRNVLVSVFLLVLPVLYVNAQAAKSAVAPDPLFQTISALDTAMFDAYNKCDLKKLGTFVSDDLEFYHDQTGLAVGKKIFLKRTKNNICGKVHRELVPGTMEVYPLKGFGAVEIGVHRFSHPGMDDGLGEAKFILIWHNKDGVWKMTRVISFDHAAVPK
jgi:Domain of unknown function (DUF4440)